MISKNKITVFTAARSDFGILKYLITKLEKDRRFNLNLIINSAHVSNKFGETIKEINEIKIKTKIFFDFKYKKSSPNDIIKYFNLINYEISLYIKRNKPKAFIIMGDRYEMLACAFASLQYQIPIFHLCGGSITLGSLDNIYRNSISNMADLHFVESIFHKQRLNEIGIKKKIYVVGAPALENMEKNNLPNFSDVLNKFNIKLDSRKKTIVGCFHPETNIDIKENIKNLKNFLSFIKKKNSNIIFTYPNADHGFDDYIKYINSYLSDKKNCNIVKNLGIKNYYSVLKNSDVLIGNSSSGIIESSSFKIPCVNLGNRQKNRFHAGNVIHSSFSIKDMQKTLDKALSKKFNEKVKKINNPFYKKNTSDKIIETIYAHLKNKIN